MGISVQAFLLCDSVVIDSQSGKTIVQGIFDRVYAPKFPATHPHCSVFCRLLLEDEASCQIGLVVQAPSGSLEQPMKPQSLKFVQNQALQTIVNIQGFPLPQEGEYVIKLEVNGRILSEFRLQAIRTGAPNEQVSARGAVH